MKSIGSLSGASGKMTKDVRVKETIDNEIIGMGREDVKKKVQSVCKYQGRIKPSKLYSRSWEDTSEFYSYKNDMENSFTVMQFNILAEGLSSGPTAPTHFEPKTLGKNNYGGFTEVPHRETCIDFYYRKWRILEVILHPNPPDIIGLEEIDNYYNFFKPILELFGYESVFEPKPNAPGVNFGWYSDGCALFWKSEVFRKKDHLSKAYEDQHRNYNQVYIIACLRHKRSNKDILVLVTHLKAKNGEKNESIRSKEIQILTKLLEERRKVQNIPILILGDFNATPDSKCIRMLQEKLRVESAYTQLNNQDLHQNQNDIQYTTFKIRGSFATKRVIDYIFYSPKILECVRTLSIPESNTLEESKLPGFRFPSDHMNISAIFCFPAE